MQLADSDTDPNVGERHGNKTHKGDREDSVLLLVARNIDKFTEVVAMMQTHVPRVHDRHDDIREATHSRNDPEE